ncbi:MAG TPA: FkbM family methyltransferase, partial [Elusimicrobiota bacterium]|nr:FkbM family methyltransferase [Elusimicrobiota bacterium]
NRAPWYFTAARRMVRKGWRGAYRFRDLLRDMGLLNCVVRYALAPKVSMLVPIFRAENEYILQDIWDYERTLLELVTQKLRAWDNPVICCDCGADIGIFSLVMAARCSAIEQIVAFEPNSAAFHYLKQNLEALVISARPINSAVGRFKGRGRLRIPDYDSSDHAAYMEPAEDGAIDILRVDDLGLDQSRTLLLKIDVEGSELDVINGARNTLVGCQHFVMTIEACRDVVRRTRVDVCDIANVVRSIRPCEILVAEAPRQALDLNRPFFEQFTQRRVYNLVLSSA